MTRMAARVQGVGPSVFAEINNLARQHQAVNLSQGAPDFDASPEVIAAAVAALESGLTTQYAPSLGMPKLRQAVADHAKRHYGQQVDPVHEVLITGGASLGIYFVLMGLVDPGDEVIVFEPFFDTYVPNIEMAGAVPRYVPLHPPHWQYDPDDLRAAFNDRTKLILINTPHNPTGKVFSPEELAFIADLCQEWDVIALTDEVYEHLLYDDAQHIRLAMLPGMADRTVTISSAGKTFSVTGFKIGWVIGPADLLEGAKRMHEFSMFAVAHPLQEAVATALNFPDSYYTGLKDFYQPRRDRLAAVLTGAGMKLASPPLMGAYYLVADFGGVFDGDDMAFARHLITSLGVACIPASPFFSPANQSIGQKLARFTFCKQETTLDAAAERIARFKPA
jgi:N-succinyldiaminopimelate aminotransferase